MKRFFPALVLAVALVVALASPAPAASLKLSATAKQRASKTVVFTAKPSKRARVSVAVYRNGRKVRALSASKSGSSYVAKWTGSSVTVGTYTYQVTATASGAKKMARGSVKVVQASAPAPALVSVITGKSRWVGLYVPGSPSDLAPLTSAESVAGTHTAVVNFFVSDSESFPTSRCNNVAGHGSVPLVTLEFWSIGTSGVSAITNGSKDAYIKKFADDAKSYGGEVWLRTLHEMNGNWYPWGGPINGNSGPKFIAAWRHIHDIFVAEGATNVKFVWNVNNDSVPNTSANAIKAYWPGDAYVDYATMDGYNAGNTQSWSSWRPFADCFGSAYSQVTALTSKPMFIAETSCLESGGSKATWISDMFKVIPSKFPRLVGVCWFDAMLDSDWRLETSAASSGAFRASVASGF